MSSSLVENLPLLFLLKLCFIVAREVVPVSKHLPMRACEHFCQQVKDEAGVCQKMRQVSVGHGLIGKRIASLSHLYCLLFVKQPVRREKRDDGGSGAGDGTRTRDSLLGRQIVAKSPLTCFRLALEEPSSIAHAIQASLRQMVARIGRQMVICFPSHHTLVFARKQAIGKDALCEPVWQRSRRFSNAVYGYGCPE